MAFLLKIRNKDNSLVRGFLMGLIKTFNNRAHGSGLNKFLKINFPTGNHAEKRG